MQISFTHGPGELPRAPAYHLLVVGAFDPAANDSHPTPIRVSRRDFQGVFDGVAPAIALDIDNLLSGRSETWWVRLQFRALKDFTPAALIRQIPELDWIDAFRRTIDDVAAGKRPTGILRDCLSDYAGIEALAEAIDRCRAAIADDSTATAPSQPRPPSEPTSPTPADDGLDRLFDMVAAPQPDDTGSAARDAVAGAIASVSRKGGGTRPRPALADASAQVTALLQAQLQGILSHPRFLELEQTWRGLHWLLSGVGGDVPVDVQILPRGAATTAAAIASATPTDAAESAARFDLVLVDLAVGLNDLDWLQGLASAAEAAMMPVLISLGTDFFKTPPDRPLGRLRDPANLLGQPEYLRWNACCDDAPMRWVGACFNDMILRPPYAEGDRHAAGIAQPNDPLTHGLWGHAGWLVARRIVEQQQQSDWPVPITGAKMGRLTDLALTAPGDMGDQGQQRPLRHALSPEQAEQLAEVGIIALSCAADQDSAWIIRAPSLLRINAQAQAEETRARRRDASLPAQLIRARLVHCILSALDQLPSDPIEQRAAALARYAQALVADTGGSAQATADVDPENPDQIHLVVSLGERVLSGVPVELQLG